MAGRVFSHFRSNVIAYLALFFSLGLGTAWALERDSVKSKHIKDGQVKSEDVADNSLGSLDIDEGSLGVVQGLGRIVSGRAILVPPESTDLLVVPEIGVIEANCNLPGHATVSFVNLNSNDEIYIVLDNGDEQPEAAEVVSPGETLSSTTTLGRDLVTIQAGRFQGGFAELATITVTSVAGDDDPEVPCTFQGQAISSLPD